MGMYEIVCDEIEQITQEGLSTRNIDLASKLIDMKKDLVTIASMEDREWQPAEDETDAQTQERLKKVREAMLKSGMTENEVETYMRKLR